MNLPAPEYRHGYYPDIPVAYRPNQISNRNSGPDIAGGLRLLALFLGLILIVATNLPLYQRTLMSKNMVVWHIQRTLIPAFAGIALLASWAIGGWSGFHAWGIGLFSILGAALVVFAGITALVGWLQLQISTRFSEKTRGNGYGWPALICLLTGGRPSHVWTAIQDAAVLGAGIWFVNSMAVNDRPLGIIVFGGGVMALGWNWFCHTKRDL